MLNFLQLGELFLFLAREVICMLVLNYFRIFHTIQTVFRFYFFISFQNYAFVIHLLCRYVYLYPSYINSLQLFILCFHLFFQGMTVHEELFKLLYLLYIYLLQYLLCCIVTFCQFDILGVSCISFHQVLHKS